MTTTATYLGAHEFELSDQRRLRKATGYADQSRLFPHRGGLRLEPDELVLEDWETIPRDAVESVSVTFTDRYRRRTAAGFRGQYASFGLFGDLGKPLVLTVRDEDPLYLLIDFRWLTGINQARKWGPTLSDWAAGVPIN